MRILRQLLACLLLCTCALAAEPNSRALAITNVNIVDVTDGSVERNVTIYIRGSHIQWVAKVAMLEHGEHLQVVNGVDRYVIPGLWNMHMHLVQDVPADYTEKVLMPLMIANGVTGARDMGGNLTRLKALRERIASGELLGPRIVLAGPMLDGPQPAYSDSLAISTTEDARTAVRLLKEQGVDFIKVQSLLPRAAYFAVADEAKKQALNFVGHVPDAVTAAEASQAGQRSMEHMLNILRGCSTEERPIMAAAAEFAARAGTVTPAQASAFGQAQRERILRTYSPARADDLFQRLLSNRNWQTPTLVQLRFFEYADVGEWDRDARMRFVPAFLRDRWKQQREDFLKERSPANLAGWKAFFRKTRQQLAPMRRDYVHFLTGTDSGPYAFPGSALHDELELLVENGLSPLSALRGATIEAAIVMGRQRDTGAIAQGRFADIVFLDGNPLEDIRNVRKVSAVVYNGHFYDRRDLAKITEAAAQAAGAMK
ncbi:MAG TPA: amidohydrolase family protein [Terriglobales bacterium]|nr:amidohydrolase family protein [Terriglobales bacterium]